VVRSGGQLIAGARRLRAFKQLGRDKIRVTVVDIERVVLGEYAENAERKDFTPAEAVAILREARPAEEKAARERQREAGRVSGKGKKKTAGANCPFRSRAALPTRPRGRRARSAARWKRPRRSLQRRNRILAYLLISPNN
jgi:ParB-like chromosome segregation protein Spo0J